MNSHAQKTHMLKNKLCFFKKALKSLEAVEPHVKNVTEQQHIDYHFSGLEDDDGDDNDDDYGIHHISPSCSSGDCKGALEQEWVSILEILDGVQVHEKTIDLPATIYEMVIGILVVAVTQKSFLT